jgi:hypothetical protein
MYTYQQKFIYQPYLCYIHILQGIQQQGNDLQRKTNSHIFHCSANLLVVTDYMYLIYNRCVIYRVLDIEEVRITGVLYIRH